ncbi:hypothetical protein [Streptomyces sp. NPDC056844]
MRRRHGRPADVDVGIEFARCMPLPAQTLIRTRLTSGRPSTDGDGTQ